ncbi:hypothetical protein [Sulfurospirillum oryzae]|uniref:hypothetical protein n=1 Tax=Sulfurospirillum oryzae TaxID=2976535 RepID=UPI0021E7AEE1|nr:hypothetical protein [Sulfurospirillum oryzae]
MKTLFRTTLGLLLALSISSAKSGLSLGSEVQEYDKIFEKIAERRSGADVTMIDKLENPFINSNTELINSDSNATSEITVYILEATFDQKAKINGNWYAKNDSVGSYKLVKITRDSVILQNEIEKKELALRTKNESNIKIFTK